MVSVAGGLLFFFSNPTARLPVTAFFFSPVRSRPQSPSTRVCIGYSFPPVPEQAYASPETDFPPCARFHVKSSSASTLTIYKIHPCCTVPPRVDKCSFGLLQSASGSRESGGAGRTIAMWHCTCRFCTRPAGIFSPPKAFRKPFTKSSPFPSRRLCAELRMLDFRATRPSFRLCVSFLCRTSLHLPLRSPRPTHGSFEPRISTYPCQ